MNLDVVTGVALDQSADPASYARAILNILTDFGEEKNRLAEIQKAMLNILDDSGVEKLDFEAAQKATFNILADFGDERAKLADVQKAVLNILEDFDAEKNTVKQINQEMAREIGARKQAEEEIHRLNEELEERVYQRTAELEASNKELEAFSYSVSHDLRAPLRSIDGFSGILLEDFGPQLPDEAQRYLGMVRANTKQMGQLVDDLLGFARLSRQPLNKQPVAVEGIVRQVLDELRAEQDNRHVEISIGTLPQCQADPVLLKRVYANLIANAFKYTRKREHARIEVSSEQGTGDSELPTAHNPPSTVYYVRDNGVGFDMKYVDKLFGVFQRLHRAEDYEGTGVGLAIVQRIIHRHGGRVWAKGEVDQGATFYFTI